MNVKGGTELSQYLAWRADRKQARAAHPCAMQGCAKKVSGNKIFCLACWEKAKADVDAEAATRQKVELAA